MANRIVLISDDSDFFDYIRQKLELRKSDELFSFSFDEIPEKIHLLTTAVLIVNSENTQDKTLGLLKITKGTPSMICAYNEDDIFKRKCLREGAFDFMSILTPDADFRARMIPALSTASILEKNELYREILVKNEYLSTNNEVFLNYNYLIDNALLKLNDTQGRAVFGAIAPDDKTKFLIKPNMIETAILNNIRRNDILMNYAPNKYFMILFDSDIKSAEKLWSKINSQIQQKLYAGFITITNQNRQQLIDKALDKLHNAINNRPDSANLQTAPINSLNNISANENYTTFKMFRQDFKHKIEKIITPVFYQIQQKYSGKLTGVTLEQGYGEGYGTFYIKGRTSISCFRITSPGFSKINIDITRQKDSQNIDAKRITLEPEELEAGLLEDLLEQFISDYKGGGK